MANEKQELTSKLFQLLGAYEADTELIEDTSLQNYFEMLNARLRNIALQINQLTD